MGMYSKCIKESRVLVFLFCIFFALAGYGQKADFGVENDGYYWTDIRDFDIMGKGWKHDSLTFNRLPAKAKGIVREAVWNLSGHTAGFFVRFSTNATTLKAHWSLTGENISMNHFAATGVSGLDLYVKQADGSWHWLGVGRPEAMENTSTLVAGLDEGSREYMLYLPLYNGVHSVHIGVEDGFFIQGIKSEPEKAIVVYGTSIIQGGCASRPGMCSTAILGRRLDREIINLGFSGNGRMEPELAHLLAELDPLIYFLDCLPNMQAEDVKERVEPFVAILREAHPDTPIVLAEGVTYNDAFLVERRRLRNSDSRRELRIAYENLLAEGYKQLYYQIAENQLGSDGEGTVDGTHPTDLGFYRQANTYQLLLENIINALPPEK